MKQNNFKMKDIDIFKCQQDGDYIPFQNGKRDSLFQPWNHITNIIMYYITIEGRYSIIFGYRFIMMNHFSHR